MWNWVTGGAITSVLEAGKGLVGTIVGDKVQQEASAHGENMGLRDQYAAEVMASSTRRTLWDSFIDGLNRLVRPVYSFGTPALFIWAVTDPDAFSKAMSALALVPVELWIIQGTIVAFWFGTRSLLDVRSQSISNMPPLAPPTFEAEKTETVEELPAIRKLRERRLLGRRSR